MATEFVPEMKSDKQAAEVARLREQVQVLREALTGFAFLDQCTPSTLWAIDVKRCESARAALAATEEK